MADTETARSADQPALALARHGFDSVHRDPGAAADALHDVVGDASATPEALVLAHWGLGRLHHDAGRMHEAIGSYRSALAIADEHALADSVPQIMLSFSSTLLLVGDHQAALAGLDEAATKVSGATLGRLLTQRSLVLSSLGRIDDAVGAADRALELLRAEGDVVGEIRLRVNRGVMLMPLGRTAQVRRDLEIALDLAERHEQHVLAAGAAHNLGYLDFLLGRMPSALRAYAVARQQYESFGGAGRNNAALDADESQLLLAAGFPEEALEIADRLIVDAVATGNVHQQADGELVAAQANLQLGRGTEAEAAARRAADLFRSSEREPWTAVAQYVGALAAAQAEPAHAIPALQAAATTLSGIGWQAETAEVLVRLGAIALAAGRVDVARDALGRAAAVRSRAGVRVRAAAWHATALLRLLDDQPVAARRAIDAGLRVVDRHRATLGASDLRARASGDGVELAELGVRMALGTGRAADVLVAAERWRAGSLATSAARVGGEREIDHDLAELRRLAAQLRGVEATQVDRAALLADVERLERRITAVTRMAPGDPRAIGRRLDLAGLRRRLGEATLVEYVDIDGTLTAVVATARRTRLVSLASRERVTALVDHTLFSLRRLSALPAHHPRMAAVLEQHLATVADLDALLFGPLPRRSDDLVVVPTRLLHAVPWWALPSVQATQRTVVAPSAAWWLGADDRTVHGDGTVLAHGPQLPEAAAEIAEIAGIADEGRVTVLGDGAATVDAVLAAMNAADLVHLAAHGRFNSANPMFSSLQLADGLLYVHDLERLASTPRTVVLTACSAARAGVYGGDELLGTSVAFLALGVRSVVAPLIPVRDDAAKRLAIALHARLAAGATPGAALTGVAAAAADEADPLLLAAAGSMVCISRADE